MSQSITDNPVVLTVENGDQSQLDLNQDYQMVYLNINDVQLVNESTVDNNAGLSALPVSYEIIRFNLNKFAYVFFFCPERHIAV